MLMPVFAKAAVASVAVVAVASRKLVVAAVVAAVVVEQFAAGEGPVAEVEGRIALEDFVVVGRIAGEIQAAGL